MSFSNGTGWQSWQDVTVGGVSLSAGVHELRFVSDPDSFNLNHVDFDFMGVIIVEPPTPLANAGPDQSVTLPAAANLSGNASPEGVLNTLWSATGPGTVTFGDAAALATTASFSGPGEYILTLTVDDGDLANSDSLLVSVAPEPVNQAPRVAAGADQEVTMSSPAVASLNGSASDDGLPGESPGLPVVRHRPGCGDLRQ
jgi:hypothetical protein